MRVVFLTGAGISAESGLATYRGGDGLWDGLPVEQVASIAGWKRNRYLVNAFHDKLRREVLAARPNAAHDAIADLQRDADVTVVTQNVDDLHERAGSQKVVHLHGEILVARSTKDQSVTVPWTKDIEDDDRCPLGARLRPHVTWFGEDLDRDVLMAATSAMAKADLVAIVGTSLQVWPAAGLLSHCSPMQVHVVDSDPLVEVPHVQVEPRRWVTPATVGVPRVCVWVRMLQRHATGV